MEPNAAMVVTVTVTAITTVLTIIAVNNFYVAVLQIYILQGMTDCHSHLLPGVDDGVRTAEESLRILEEMERQGIRKLWLTPHIMEDIPNTTDALKTRFRTLCESYRGNIRLELSLHEEKRYLLVETSYFNPPMRLLSMLKHIQEKGYHPLLAHPERYEYMQMADYKALQQVGVAFQLNIPSLAGMYGRHVQKKAEALQEAGMYTLHGNDTHSLIFFQNLLNEKIRK